MKTLAEELEALPADLAEVLGAHRFDAKQLVQFAARANAKNENRVAGEVAPPTPNDIVELPATGSAEEERIRARGVSLLKGGQSALVVLAGGMATRMGGVVKALVEALPGHTFLDLRLAERDAIERLTGRKFPLWLMTSAATDDAIRRALGDRIDGVSLAVFPQRLSLRLTPDGQIFRDAQGKPSEYAPGHGDLVDALRDSGLLARFLDGGGKTLTVANLDNLGATLDPVVLGLHAERGRAATCELVDKVDADRGGIPVRVGARTLVLEEFRLPADFDAAKVRVFSTNTFHFDAAALAGHDAAFTYFVVQKKVEGQPVIQFERLINELTSQLETLYVRVPRTGVASRFLPVKDPDELLRRRPEIELVVRSRGMLG